MRIPFRRSTRPKRDEAEPTVVVELDSDQLRQMSALFAAPRWLRDLGLASWFLVGVAALIVGLVWLLGLTSTITGPVLVGLVLATVTSPVVSWLQAHRVPRAAGALIVLLALVALGVLMLVLVLGGIVAQKDNISAYAAAAADKAQGWLEDVGVDSSGAESANDKAQSSVSDAISVFVNGVVAGIKSITSLALFVSFTAFSLFFLLKDGPGTRRWIERRMGVPLPVAQTITRNVISSLRRYFAGVTIVAAFNAVVVGVGALLLDVPLAGTIAVVTFALAYIPFIGAFVSGAFAVVLALGAEGTQTALIMLVIVILANGALQNIVQPIAFGATLKLNPLIVLIVTISAGALFGMVGMILAAPLTSAALHISANLAQAKAGGTVDTEAEPEPPAIPLIDAP